MASLTLREAAEQTQTSKSTIWRAIKGGRLSAARTDDGGFAIDPAELFRAFPPGSSPARQPAKPLPMDETALKQALAVAEANLQSLKAMLDEVKAGRDDLRRERDMWMEQARQLLLAAPIAVSPAPSPAAPDSRRSWWRRLAG